MACLSADEGFELLKTGQYSDLTLTCGNTTFRVHKAVVCPKCKFFKACLKGGFVEATTSDIKMEETQPGILAAALVYLYTGAIEGKRVLEITRSHEVKFIRASPHGMALRMNVDLYQLADLLMLQQLQAEVAPMLKVTLSCLLSDPGVDWTQALNGKEPYEELASTLDYAFERIPAHNVKVRVQLTNSALAFFSDQAKPRPLIQVLNKHEPVAFRTTLAARGIGLDND